MSFAGPYTKLMKTSVDTSHTGLSRASTTINALQHTKNINHVGIWKVCEVPGCNPSHKHWNKSGATMSPEIHNVPFLNDRIKRLDLGVAKLVHARMEEEQEREVCQQAEMKH